MPRASPRRGSGACSPCRSCRRRHSRPRRASRGSVIAPGAKLEKLAGGFAFTEGPTSDKDGNVFFTDQPNNRILKWSVDGALSTFLAAGGPIERDVLRRRRATCSPARTRRRSCGRSRRTARTRCWRRSYDGQAAQRPERRLGAAGRRDLLHRPVLQARLVGAQRAAAGQPAGLLPLGRSQDAAARDRRSRPAQRHHRHAGRQDALRRRHPRAARPTRSTSSPTAA